MIRCSQCQHQEWTGALFCSECGARLFPFRDGNTADSEPVLREDIRSSPKLVLHIIEEDIDLPINLQQEVTLGRTSENQPIMPDVDLNPFGAYEAGVSRMHASVRIEDNSVWITDLRSANGTRINGQRVPPGTPMRLNNEDILTLGKLKILVQLI